MAMTIEQQRALALAAARLRLQQQGPAPQPSQGITGAQMAQQENLPVPGTPMTPPRPGPTPIEAVGDAAKALQSGAMQGMTMNFGDEIQAGLKTLPVAAIEGIQGQPLDLGRSYNTALDLSRGYDQEVQGKSPIAATVGNIGGAIGTGIGLNNAGMTLMKGASPTIASMGGRAALEGAAYGAVNGFGAGKDLPDRLNQAAGGALVGGALGGVTGGIAGAIANKSAQAAAGSVDALKSEASTLYDSARASGVVAPQQTTQALAQQMKGIATAEGVISPTGRINSTYPEIAEVLRTVDDYATGTMTVPQMQAVRQVLTDAAKSQKGGERRIAVLMLEQLDNMTSTLAPELQAANGIYHRAMNADLLEEAVLVARQKSGQYGRSLDATLREQFGSLERDIIKGNLRGFSEAEKAAISKVAQGGPIEGILGLIGKAAPTGVVSAGAGFGVPFAVGNAVGGPVVGAAAGAGTVGAGLAARYAASNMTQGSARNAVMQALLGSAKPQANAAIAPVVQALVAAEGNQAPRIPMEVLRALSMN